MTEKVRRPCKLLCDINSVKTHVNRPDCFEKLGFQDKIFSKDTILSIFAPVTPKLFFAKKRARKKFGQDSFLNFFARFFSRTLTFFFINQTLLGIKRIVSLLKILSWKTSFSKKSDWLTQVFTLLLSHNNSHASSKRRWYEKTGYRPDLWNLSFITPFSRFHTYGNLSFITPFFF